MYSCKHPSIFFQSSSFALSSVTYADSFFTFLFAVLVCSSAADNFLSRSSAKPCNCLNTCSFAVLDASLSSVILESPFLIASECLSSRSDTFLIASECLISRSETF